MVGLDLRRLFQPQQFHDYVGSLVMGLLGCWGPNWSLSQGNTGSVSKENYLSHHQQLLGKLERDNYEFPGII